MSEVLQQVWEEFTRPGGPFGVEEIEIRGVPQRVYSGAVPSLRTVWDLAGLKGDRDYLVFEGERYTYAEADRAVRSLAAGLAALGVGPGDRVAIAMRNYPEWVLAFWATVSTGAVAVGLNAWWTGPELEYGLLDSEVRVLVCDAERLERVLPHLDVLRADRPFELVAVRSPSVPEGVHRIDDLLADEAPPPLPAVAIDPEADALILYTSGTTGHPKGAVLTHRACVANVFNMIFWTAYAAEVANRTRAVSASAAGEPDGEVVPPAAFDASFMLVVPLFHVTGLTCVLLTGTLAGAKHTLMRKWDAEEALALIERERITAFTGVPTMSRELLASPDLHRYDTSSLASLGGGGAPLQPDLVEKIDEQVASARPGTGYGLTETAGVVSMNSADLYRARPTTVGPALPTMEVKVVDESGAALPVGQVGELWVRGSNVFRGYLNRPEATAEAITDGWFHTGDLATLDEDGFITIVDRAKDMVLRGGENVYCAEVEAAVYEHPAVRECAVFAVPDERLGEVPGAAVVLHPGSRLDVEGLRAFVGERIARFKVPERVWFLDADLPRNANGKFLKRDLRDRLVGSPGEVGPG